jgi:hypothetical protein
VGNSVFDGKIEGRFVLVLSGCSQVDWREVVIAGKIIPQFAENSFRKLRIRFCEKFNVNIWLEKKPNGRRKSTCH